MKKALSWVNTIVAWATILCWVSLAPVVLMGEWEWALRIAVATLPMMFVVHNIQRATA